MKRQAKNVLKNLLWRSFVWCQRLGVNVLPNHFYSQVPNIQELRNEHHWREPMSLIGVRGSEIASQVRFLEATCGVSTEWVVPATLFQDAIRENQQDGGFGEIESVFLYEFVRRYQPRKMIQVGCGVSTAVALRAAREAGFELEVTCVEPFPSPFLRELAAAGKILLVEEKAQKVEVSFLSDLGENDLLFIDSTHTVKPGSEVNRIILEVLPRLLPDVWVHFHDIYFPYDYRRNLLASDLFFWLESTLLHAFLIDNQKVEIKVSQSMLHYAAPDSLKKYFPIYDPVGNDDGLDGIGGEHFPASTYLRTQAVPARLG